MAVTKRSQFRWIQDWWRAGGGATVSGTAVTFPATGGTTAVNEPAAAIIPNGGIDLHIRYRSPSEGVTMTAYLSAFKGEGGHANRLGDGPQHHTWLPQATESTDMVIQFPANSIVKPEQAVRYRPVLKINGAGLVLEDVHLVPRPVNEGVVAWAGAEAQGSNGRDKRLSVPSVPGDIAIMVMASQFGHTKCRPPEGWTFEVTNDVPSGRSGYVAWKRVASPADTENVDPWGGQQNGARDRAALVVTSMKDAPTIGAWAGDVPGESTDNRIVFSQFHGASATQDNEWTIGDTHVGSVGTRVQGQSWSTLRIGYGKQAPSLQGGRVTPQGWATVGFPTRVGPRLSVWHNRTEVPATAARMPRGAASTQKLVEKRGFVVAHRGGSVSWAEMSMLAYTQSVAFGVDALEVSAHKTSDGVWACVHDQNLKRIDPSAPDTAVSQMTWAQVQQYRTQGQPIIRLEQLIEAYGNSHVLVADPKYSAAEVDEFMAFFNPERTILKYSFDATWLADRWRQAGFKTWGYAYGPHIDDGRMAQSAPHWDYMGMELVRDEDTFKRALQAAGGKPVWGHILSTKEQYDRMMSWGAAGCMVSGVSSVLRRQA